MKNWFTEGESESLSFPPFSPLNYCSGCGPFDIGSDSDVLLIRTGWPLRIQHRKWKENKQQAPCMSRCHKSSCTAAAWIYLWIADNLREWTCLGTTTTETNILLHIDGKIDCSWAWRPPFACKTKAKASIDTVLGRKQQNIKVKFSRVKSRVTEWMVRFNIDFHPLMLSPNSSEEWSAHHSGASTHVTLGAL